MKNIHIDMEFAPRQRRLSIKVIGAFVISCLLFAASVAAVRLQLAANAEQEKSMGRATQSNAATLNKPPKPVRMDSKALARHQLLKQVSHGLETPWADLLASLETAPADVALLSVEPSAAKRSLLLTAETAGPKEMLNYLRALQTDPHFSNAALVSHQVQVQAPGTPLLFKLHATWGDAP
jgi:Tfp pilus assembly protein PilN